MKTGERGDVRYGDKDMKRGGEGKVECVCVCLRACVLDR